MGLCHFSADQQSLMQTSNRWSFIATLLFYLTTNKPVCTNDNRRNDQTKCVILKYKMCSKRHYWLTTNAMPQIFVLSQF